MISKEDLQEFFTSTRKLRDSGEANFDIDDVCRWSYFFTDTVKSNLTRIGLHLEDNGYQIRGFLGAAEEDADPNTLYIRADRHEKHTVETLHETNESFYILAEKMGVGGYDGMDVGAIGSV
tara:strand:- start:135 stop:497 length:363 start_codon:yes stop_codon:yes gene_type:complete